MKTFAAFLAVFLVLLNLSAAANSSANSNGVELIDTSGISDPSSSCSPTRSMS
jgi:hypothetical protein